MSFWKSNRPDGVMYVLAWRTPPPTGWLTPPLPDDMMDGLGYADQAYLLMGALQKLSPSSQTQTTGRYPFLVEITSTPPDSLRKLDTLTSFFAVVVVVQDQKLPCKILHQLH